jgi:hypothetical protein
MTTNADKIRSQIISNLAQINANTIRLRVLIDTPSQSIIVTKRRQINDLQDDTLALIGCTQSLIDNTKTPIVDEIDTFRREFNAIIANWRTTERHIDDTESTSTDNCDEHSLAEVMIAIEAAKKTDVNDQRQIDNSILSSTTNKITIVNRRRRRVIICCTIFTLLIAAIILIVYYYFNPSIIHMFT